MEKIVKGIVISVKNYREFDVIARILTANRFFSVIAMGVRKPQSKNRFGLILGTYGEFEIYASRFKNKVSKLKKANPIRSFEILNKENQLTFKELFFQLNRLESTSFEFFDFLERFWPEWGTGKNYLMLTLILNQALKLYGYYPDYKACVDCGQKAQIADFKFYKGGFLCQFHKTQDLSLEKLYAYFHLDNNYWKYLSETSSLVNQEIYQELKLFLDENMF